MISIIDVINCVVGFVRPLREGEEVLISGLIVSVGLREKREHLRHIQALVLRTSGIKTENPYVSNIWIDNAKKFGEKVVRGESLGCRCPAGQSLKCKHVVAVLLHLSRNKMEGRPTGYLPADESFATRAIHTGHNPDHHSYGPIVAPLYTSSTFKQDSPGQTRGYDYGRGGNPTRQTLENVLASLDKADHGLAFSSGLGAMSAIIELLKNGDHIVCGDDVYGGANRYFQKVAVNHGLDTVFVDTTSPEEVVKAIKPNTKMVWLESPSNPMMKITDIPKVSEAIKRVKPDIILVIDNTFLTSYFQQPLTLGADLVVYSITKYLNGHSDVIMGALTTNRKDLYERLQFIQMAAGYVPSPFDCFLVLRSLKTLAVRMDQHMRSAVEITAFLEKHPLVEKVIFPGAKSHPQHELAKKLWTGVSGMLSVYIKGGVEEINRFLKALKVFTLAESLGGYESLIEIPSIMTHASVPPEMRKKLGITDNLFRLSVGLESTKGLIEDLDQALKAASSPKAVNGAITSTVKNGY